MVDKPKPGLFEKLRGKKTYIVSALLVIVAGLEATGKIDPETAKWIQGLLLGTGVATIRAAIADKKR